jgi:hypothetical protein
MSYICISALSMEAKEAHFEFLPLEEEEKIGSSSSHFKICCGKHISSHKLRPLHELIMESEMTGCIYGRYFSTCMHARHTALTRSDPAL